MKKVKIITTIEQTWLIFDPNKLISISVDTHQRTLNGRQVLTVSFSGSLTPYDNSNYPENKYIDPYFGTIIHYYGGVDLNLPHNSSVYNTSGHFVRSSMVAQTSIREAIAGLLTRRGQRMVNAQEEITIEVTEEGIGLCNFSFETPFFFIKFQEGLRHREIHLEHQAFENYELKGEFDCNKNEGFYKGTLQTLLGMTTSGYRLHHYTTLYYEDNECREGFVLYNEVEGDHVYHITNHRVRNPYLFDGKGIENTNVKGFVAIPHGFTVQKIFKGYGIILFSASWVSPDREFKSISLLPSSFIGEEEHFSFTLAEYQTTDELDDFIQENNITLDHILEDGTEYEPTLHDFYVDYALAYHESSNEFDPCTMDLFYITSPLDYYFLGALEQADPKCAMTLFLCYIINLFFEGGIFYGESIAIEDYQSDDESYLTLVARILFSKEKEENLNNVWKAYSRHLHEFNGGKLYKKQKYDMLYGDDFPTFFVKYIWQYSHSEEHILGLIKALLTIMYSYE